MSFSFGKPNDLIGLENVMAWGQGQGQLTADGNWSDVQRAAFAAIAGSFGYTDADGNSTYEYDGKTTGPTGEEQHKLVDDALTTAANAPAVDAAEVAKGDADWLEQAGGKLDQLFEGKQEGVLLDQQGAVLNQQGVSPFAPARKELDAEIKGAAQDAVDAVAPSLQETQESADLADTSVAQAKAAGYSVEEGEKAAAAADDSVKAADAAAVNLKASASTLLGAPVV